MKGFWKSIWIFLIVIVLSCDKKRKIAAAIAKIPIALEVERFDQKFATTSLEGLSGLQSEYPFLFPKKYADSIWWKKVNDTIQQEINRAVDTTFGDFSKEHDALYKLLQHLNFYFPEVGLPARVITITSDVNYEHSVILTDELLLLSLDTYLGADHEFYIGIQEYIRKNFRKKQLLPAIVNAYGNRMIDNRSNRTFLAHMVYYGKITYLKEVLLPDYEAAELMGYTPDEYAWTQENEVPIWRYFIEKELLYDTNQQLLGRFLHPAPFSKFYLALDNQSPGRVGQYIGWQIVRAYMKNNEVSLQQLLKTDGETIFKTSKYKPAK